MYVNKTNGNFTENLCKFSTQRLEHKKLSGDYQKSRTLSAKNL